MTRVKQALSHVAEVAAQKKPEEKAEARASTTDPEARVMKMGDGGFRPAFNGQFGVDVESQVVVGVDISNSGADQNKMPPMVEQIENRYDCKPKEILVDGGFVSHESIEKVTEAGVTVYAPVRKSKDNKTDPYAPKPTDSEVIAEWRSRMASTEAKAVMLWMALAHNMMRSQALIMGDPMMAAA